MPAPSEFRDPVAAQLKKISLKKLGLQSLPPQLAKDIDKKAGEITDKLWDIEISKEGLREAKTILQASNVQANVQARLADALTGMKTVSQSADLQKILDENAKMLRAKYNALVNAGFSGAEAFELLKVELASRKAG